MREFAQCGASLRDELLAQQTPAVLRGLAAEWPAVRAGLRSAESLAAYLKALDSGAAVDALLTPPEVDGRLHYNADMSGFNFHRNRLPLSQIIDQVLRYARFEKSPAVAAQSALIRDCLPGFTKENSLAFLGDEVLPRIWLGNRITTPAHVDEWNNIGCVVAGRRRFTLFPPEQLVNLYVGPLDFAPTGAPMSMASLHAPDFDRYPKFRLALEAAQCAELAPGDALYIPPLWWHHVESLEPFNVLVNYWWHDRYGEGALADSAFEALVHGILSIRSLPPQTRAAWRAFFEHYVFGEERDSGHIPEARLGLLGDLTPELRSALRSHLSKRLAG